jgi:hypothetical protein
MSRLDSGTITKVEIEAPASGLLGAHIDHPVPGTRLGAFALEVRGWAVGADAPVAAIEVSLGARGTTVATTLGEPRPDVAGELPDTAQAQGSGFRMLVGLLENRARFGLEVHARLADGTRVRVGRIEGERRRVTSAFDPTMQPLMLNTIGRSGSTWLAWVLSCHPEVVGYRPMRYETRVATYWMSVLQGLAQPRSYLSQLVATGLDSDRRWWLGDGARSTPKIEDPALAAWLGGEAVESMAAMCQSRIDAFFRQVAEDYGKPDARFFLEKFLLEPVVLDLLAELYGATREIILVRDFRDVVSSVLAFNRKRGFQTFGREHVNSDVEYVRSVAMRQALGIMQRWQERKDGAHLVRYEDLLMEPEASLARTFEFVGVDASPDVIEKTLERARSDAPSMDHHRTAAEPDATIGRWREDLSAELISACAESLDPVLEAFGYEPTRPSAVSAPLL